MKTSVKAVLYLLTWLHLSAIGCHGVTVFPMVISPREPINGENATLECYAIDYDPALHSWKWRKRTNGTFVDISADERIEFLPVQQEPPTSYSGSMAINRLEESDEGQYNCEVVATSSGTIVGNSAANLFVNYPNEFPVCFPEGPSTVTEGDTLSCKTVVEERTPEVRLVDDPASESENWVENSAGENVSGSELIKNVMIADGNSTFYCFSRLRDVRKTLSCTIGPLTVTPRVLYTSPNSETEITSNNLVTSCTNPSVGAVGIAGVTFSVLVVLLGICINCLCFRYDPKRLDQLLGYCRRTKTSSRKSSPDDQSNRHTDQRPYESSITGPAKDKPQKIAYVNVEANVGSSTEQPTPPPPHNQAVEISMDSAVSPSSFARKPAGGSATSADDPSYDWPAPTTHKGSASSKPTDAYMELQGKPNTSVYTDLKI